MSVEDAHRALADLNETLVISAVVTLMVLGIAVLVWWSLLVTASRADEVAESWQPNREFLDWDADEDLAA